MPTFGRTNGHTNARLKQHLDSILRPPVSAPPARATIAAMGVSTSGNLDVETVSDDVTRAAATLSSALAPPVGHRGPPEE
jgi:hypothetical protein